MSVLISGKQNVLMIPEDDSSGEKSRQISPLRMCLIAIFNLRVPLTSIYHSRIIGCFLYFDAHDFVVMARAHDPGAQLTVAHR